MILSVDPGRDKTGCAVVEEDGSLVVKKVIPTKDYEKEIAKLLSSFTPRALIMGNGTRHREKYTTEMGEQWYRKDHPPKGLARLIPEGMRTIPVPVDDYVAWIIGNIYLGHVKAEDVGHRKV